MPRPDAQHPIGLLRRLRFRVAVNTDNRLMSGVAVSEFAAVRDVRLGASDMSWATINAMKSAFLPFDQRLVINDVIKPGYAIGALTVELRLVMRELRLRASCAT